MINILYTISAFLILIMLFLVWRIMGASKRHIIKMDKMMAQYKNEIDDLSMEVQRQALVIVDYKDRLQFNPNTINKISNSVNVPDFDTAESMITDKQKLEKEKDQFKQKNIKLWEQSMAVYKEKERIDSVRKYIESRHANLTMSINYALRIQEALLPSEELLKEILPNHFIFYKPRDIVSGDFYWTKQIGDRTVIVAADCTGHGVPGAFMSLLGISYLNEIISMDHDISASQLLEKMRDKVKSGFKQNDGSISIQDGMDMTTCIINSDTLEMEFSGANNGIYIARRNELTEIKGTRNPISAYVKEKAFENHVIKLQANDTIVMYSDGYFDQFGGPKKDKLKRPRFNATLKHCIENNFSMSEIKNKLETDLSIWQGKEKQIDDILVFGVRV